MRVIPPIVITPAMLTSSTAAEPSSSETAWSAGDTHAIGDRRIRTTTHRVYEALAAGVDAGLPESTPSRWLDVGPTNRWAMFDLFRSSVTEQASPLTVVITPGRRVNAIALLQVAAQSVTIEMTFSGDTVYSHTQDLTSRATAGWYDFYFGEFGTQPSVLRFDLPPVSGGVITVTLSASSGSVSCGALVIGNSVDLGELEINPRSESLNFSRFDRDDFGNATLVRRRSVPKASLVVWAEKGKVKKLLEIREELNAMPAVWSGLDDDTSDGYFEALLLLGFYRAWNVDMTHHTRAVQTIEIEGY